MHTKCHVAIQNVMSPECHVAIQNVISPYRMSCRHTECQVDIHNVMNAMSTYRMSYGQNIMSPDHHVARIIMMSPSRMSCRQNVMSPYRGSSSKNVMLRCRENGGRQETQDGGIRSNGGKEQKRKTKQRLGGRQRGLGRRYTAETVPFGAE